MTTRDCFTLRLVDHDGSRYIRVFCSLGDALEALAQAEREYEYVGGCVVDSYSTVASWEARRELPVEGGVQ